MPLVDAGLWESVVTLEEWHQLRITYSAGLAQVTIDGVLVGSAVVFPTNGRTGDWSLILGNFDGDIDEVRVSTVVRTD